VETVKLITCGNLTEAHIIKGRLLNEGINCFLTNENFTNLMPLYNNILGSGVQILINIDDIEKAQLILKDIIKPNNTDLICPNCGSKNIGLGLGRKKTFKVINILLALISGFPLGNLKSNYHCKDCKTELT